LDTDKYSPPIARQTQALWWLAGLAAIAAVAAAWLVFDQAISRVGLYQPPADRPVRDAPYITTPSDVVERIVDLAGIGPNDLVYDLGCGDGRLVIAACLRHRCRGVGLEKDPARLREAQANARAAGVEDLVQFKEADILKYDFSDGDAVLLYLLPKLNAALVPQFRRLKPGSRIVSSEFEIAGLEPEAVERYRSSANGEQYTLYMYRIAEAVSQPAD
jgi:SAM-dependent methyltransferase